MPPHTLTLTRETLEPHPLPPLPPLPPSSPPSPTHPLFPRFSQDSDIKVHPQSPPCNFGWGRGRGGHQAGLTIIGLRHWAGPGPPHIHILYIHYTVARPGEIFPPILYNTYYTHTKFAILVKDQIIGCIFETELYIFDMKLFAATETMFFFSHR